jgi:mono/diheme cytochrome c family protein
MRMQVTISGLLVLGVCALGASAVQKTAPAKAAPTAAQQKALQNYQQICQPCHGPNGNSPMPMMSLVDGEWKQGSSTQAIAKTITEGIPGTAMLPKKDKFSPTEILELAKLVRTFDPKLEPEKAPRK